MEEKINIAEILKDKPQGTKLYSPIFGKLRYEDLVPDLGEFTVVTSDNTLAKHSFRSDSRYNRHGEPLMLLPSKEMRDWHKFAWKKGDLLVNSCGLQCIFKEWASDDYTKFNGCYSNSRDGYEDVSNAGTANFVKLDNNIAYGYVREIERKLGGILNLETLEIEKPQPEFKDGDIVCISGMGYLAYGIVKSIDNSSKKLEYYVLNDMSTLKLEDWLSFEDKQIQPITETQQIILFEALAKENKAWDAEKKAIEDLKPKVEFKPFDKVLCRNSKDDTWEADFFARLTRKEIDYTQSDKYLCVGDLWMYCIPYNEETAHLLGKTDEWKGGKG
jgi:hypothetical protein